MKTPEELKKGLDYCANFVYFCDEECPYCDSLSNGVDCASKLHADALAYIQQLEAKVPKWISVEDEYPDYKTAVLAYGQRWKSYNEKAEPFPMPHVAYTKGEDEGWFTYGEKCHVYPVTHWMPLPEEPEV